MAAWYLKSSSVVDIPLQVSTRISVQGLQEDLVKSRMKMQELEHRRQYEEMEKEKERMQRY